MHVGAAEIGVIWLCLMILFMMWWQSLPWEDDDDDY